MSQYRFHLRISPEQYEDYYRGVALDVVVRCHTGQTVQFPAGLLRRFVTLDGIRGEFVLSCDGNNRCTGLERVGP